jgi:penicillin amidase
VGVLEKADQDKKLNWAAYKGTKVLHLLRLAPLSRLNLAIGGGEHIINATKEVHGPSWRMIVHMTDTIEAYGVYPGGQSGNPGSKFYDTFVDTWVAGNYYPLLFLKKEAIAGNGKLTGHLKFSKA